MSRDSGAGAAATPAVLVVPDKFKGTYSAKEVAVAMAAGVEAAGARAIVLPVADGGDGSAEAMLGAIGGRRVWIDASDALGRPLRASFVVLRDGRAVVDVAEASGLGSLDPSERDAVKASSRGTGELIAAAVAAGSEEVLVCAGGSACTDGGVGLLAALQRTGARPRVTVVCDVDTPFEQAARVFAPQKGATPAQVEVLTERLEAVARAAPRDPRGRPMTGAAGGLAGGLWAHLDADIVPGAPFVLDLLDFDRRLAGASLVITGEGQIDAQTASGKAVGEVSKRAVAAGVPCTAIVGSNKLDRGGARLLGLDEIVAAGNPDAIEAAARDLVIRLVRAPGGAVAAASGDADDVGGAR